MQNKPHHLGLGILTQQKNNYISQLIITESCNFLINNFDDSSKMVQKKVLLELREDFIIQIDTTDKNILCGFKCDYDINFEIIRSHSPNTNKLGRPQTLQFIFKNKEDNKEYHRVTLIVQDEQKTQKFCRKLQKKYIVQLSFRENFRAIKILGKGVTATVYKAIRFRDQKQVAIKSFKRQVYFKNPNGKQSFQKQFKILSLLSHPHICRLQGVYQTQNSTYIVMEHLQLSLFGWIQKYGFPNLQQARKMMYHLLKSIQYLHSKGIMHRDLKLQNIMVRKDSRVNIQIVVVDLGLAQFIDSQKFLYTRCGTPGYVAPEILKIKSGQNDKYNQSCDVFSLGVLFHILFFKKTVFEGKEVKQVIKQNSECNINFQAEYLNDISVQGVDLLKRMLQKDPSQRITASEALNHPFMRINNSHQDNQTLATQLSLNNIIGVQSFN